MPWSIAVDLIFYDIFYVFRSEIAKNWQNSSGFFSIQIFTVWHKFFFDNFNLSTVVELNNFV